MLFYGRNTRNGCSSYLSLFLVSSAMSLDKDLLNVFDQNKWYCDRAGPREERRWVAYTDEQCQQLDLAYQIHMPSCQLKLEGGSVQVDFVEAFRETKGYKSFQVLAPQGKQPLPPQSHITDSTQHYPSLVEPILAGKEDIDPFIKYKTDSVASVAAGVSLKFEREETSHDSLETRLTLAHKVPSKIAQGNMDNILSSGLSESDEVLDEIFKSVARRSVVRPPTHDSTKEKTDYSSDHSFFNDLISEPTNKSDTTAEVILPNKSFFRRNSLEPYTKHTEEITLKNVTGEQVQWSVQDAASASHHHLFTCVSIRAITPPKSTANTPYDHISREETTPLPYPTQCFFKQIDREFVTQGTLAPHETLLLTISFVFLKPRQSGVSHSFERVSRVQFCTESGVQSTVFLGCAFTGRTTSKTHWTPTLEDISMGRALGKGAFGLVCDCSVLGLECAIKIWRHDALAKSTRNDFVIERDMMSSLYHDRLIPFIGAWEATSSGICFLLMKKAPFALNVHFKTLIGIAKQHPTFSISHDLRRRIGLAIAAAEGIEYLHSQSPPILHRDIKSHNMVIEDPMLYIIDFGFAGPLVTPNAKDKRYRLGTPGWSAPEASSGLYTTKSDVYSFGMLLYEVATLHTPKQDEKAILPGGHPLLSLFTICTELEPSKRPEISQVIEDLRRIFAQLQQSAYNV